ncbi:MAG TPA: hypothetical protein VFU00_10020, partial [Gemmatimonadales bacterium]|nr:hypothetical protein [Gemmatimonadales bacterium]
MQFRYLSAAGSDLDTIFGQEQFVDPNVFETANAGFAQAMYEEFLRNPESVSEGWRRLFESGVVGEMPPAPPPSGNGGARGAPQAAPVDGARAPAGEPIKGPAARLVQNMTESL